MHFKNYFLKILKKFSIWYTQAEKYREEGKIKLSTKEDIMEKLNIIGLDLDNLPSFLEDSKPIVFNPSRLNNDKRTKGI